MLVVAVAVTAFSFVWSVAFFALLGFSLDNVTPWSVYHYLYLYGFGGDAVNLLTIAFVIAASIAAVLGVAVLLLKPKTTTAMRAGHIAVKSVAPD